MSSYTYIHDVEHVEITEIQAVYTDSKETEISHYSRKIKIIVGDDTFEVVLITDTREPLVLIATD